MFSTSSTRSSSPTQERSMPPSARRKPRSNSTARVSVKVVVALLPWVVVAPCVVVVPCVVAAVVVAAVVAVVVVVVVVVVVAMVVVVVAMVVVVVVAAVQSPKDRSCPSAPLSVARCQARSNASIQAASFAAKSRTACAAGPLGSLRLPQSFCCAPQHWPRSPRPGVPPQYSPPLLATAPGIVSEVSQAQQSCSLAMTGPPFCPFSL
mmetsp:Transcript_46528/g.110593  ORF Transcript_46528/g.110593 Transcript_46528/m.110593 type:complete len:207 (-) Transcript_46528:147-767(-)